MWKGALNEYLGNNLESVFGFECGLILSSPKKTIIWQPRSEYRGVNVANSQLTYCEQQTTVDLTPGNFFLTAKYVGLAKHKSGRSKPH